MSPIPTPIPTSSPLAGISLTIHHRKYNDALPLTLTVHFTPQSPPWQWRLSSHRTHAHTHALTTPHSFGARPCPCVLLLPSLSLSLTHSFQLPFASTCAAHNTNSNNPPNLTAKTHTSSNALAPPHSPSFCRSYSTHTHTPRGPLWHRGHHLCVQVRPCTPENF